MSNLITKIENDIDGMGRSLGVTLDVSKSTAPYKQYEGTLSTSELIFDIESDLGRFGSKICVVNLSQNSEKFKISFSVDGENFGDDITVYPIFARGYDYWFSFKKIKLTRVSSNSIYDITVFVIKQ